MSREMRPSSTAADIAAVDEEIKRSKLHGDRYYGVSAVIGTVICLLASLPGGTVANDTAHGPAERLFQDPDTIGLPPDSIGLLDFAADGVRYRVVRTDQYMQNGSLFEYAGGNYVEALPDTFYPGERDEQSQLVTSVTYRSPECASDGRFSVLVDAVVNDVHHSVPVVAYESCSLGVNGAAERQPVTPAVHIGATVVEPSPDAGSR